MIGFLEFPLNWKQSIAGTKFIYFFQEEFSNSNVFLILSSEYFVCNTECMPLKNLFFIVIKYICAYGLMLGPLVSKFSTMVSSLKNLSFIRFQSIYHFSGANCLKMSPEHCDMHLVNPGAQNHSMGLLPIRSN